MEPWNNRRVPAFALAFVERCEGFEAKPYKDGGGVWTIGIGSTADKNGQPVSGNTPPVTHAEARELLERDMGKALRQVRGSVLLPLNDHQAAALIAFAYNRRVHLAGNVSLLLEFRNSTSGRGYGP